METITEQQAEKKGYHSITDYYKDTPNEKRMLKDAVKQLGTIDHVVTYREDKGYKLCRLKSELEKIYKGEKL